MKLLRRVLIVVAILLAGFLGTWAVLQHYENYKTEQRNDETRRRNMELARQYDIDKTVEAELSTVRIAHEVVRGECLKGKAAYDLLTPIQKNRVAVPECGQPLSE